MSVFNGIYLHRAIAQLALRCSHIAEVTGSIPVSPTIPGFNPISRALLKNLITVVGERQVKMQNLAAKRDGPWHKLLQDKLVFIRQNTL